MAYSARVVRSRVARCKEDRLLENEKSSFRIGGDGLEWDQDRLQPEKPYLDLRVLCSAAPVQEKPLQPPDLPSPWVTN